MFGRSRWLKALLLTTVLGTLASLAIKGTVVTTWNQNQPSTWNLPFQVAAGDHGRSRARSAGPRPRGACREPRRRGRPRPPGPSARRTNCVRSSRARTRRCSSPAPCSSGPESDRPRTWPSSSSSACSTPVPARRPSRASPQACPCSSSASRSGSRSAAGSPPCSSPSAPPSSVPPSPASSTSTPTSGRPSSSPTSRAPFVGAYIIVLAPLLLRCFRGPEASANASECSSRPSTFAASCSPTSRPRRSTRPATTG